MGLSMRVWKDEVKHQYRAACIKSLSNPRRKTIWALVGAVPVRDDRQKPSVNTDGRVSARHCQQDATSIDAGTRCEHNLIG